jgi:hypothetical protein
MGLSGGIEQVKVPCEFVIEALTPLAPRVTRFFSGFAVYIGPKFVLILHDRPNHKADNGVWLATTAAHHESLRGEFPNMRSIRMFGTLVTSWQVLPVDAPDFEESAMRACELIAARDPRIGKIPKKARATSPSSGADPARPRSRKIRKRPYPEEAGR